MKKNASSTLQLLRFHFSFFLMPVYWFGLSQVVDRDWMRALLIFAILHGLVYPASNGYNSYMDRDTTPIGGVEHPLPPTRQLFWVTLVMDGIALVLGSILGLRFLMWLAIYILASRAYSYRGIRLKKYPIIGWLTVTTCQGALIFLMVFEGSHRPGAVIDPYSVAPAMLAASLLFGGFYPLTQIYQHEADQRDGVKTLSMVLGYRGTFVFTGLIYGVAFLVLTYYFLITLQIKEFYVLATCLLPIVVYFMLWAIKVWRDPVAASFKNTMRMNLLASICTNIGFISVLVMGS
jgi:1,4-dihydroxy-2-naphthoate octaprenyltransferase